MFAQKNAKMVNTAMHMAKKDTLVQMPVKRRRCNFDFVIN